VEEVSTTEPEVSIYPNPAINNEFNIVMPELASGDSAQIFVSDLNGRTLLTERLSASGQVNHHLSSGVYVVNVISKDFKATKKLIVK
jgi:hypothetical protein